MCVFLHSSPLVVILNIQNQIIVATIRSLDRPLIGVGMIIQEMCEPVGGGGGGCDHHARRRGVRRPSRSSYARGERCAVLDSRLILIQRQCT